MTLLLPLVVALAAPGVEDLEALSANELLRHGLALARLERYTAAEAAFQAGLRKSPRDARFLVELAGVAYRQGRLGRAENRLRRALRIEPADRYARNFLGALYLLDNNLEAALNEWNRIGKPDLSDFETAGRLRLDPVLLDRSLAFAPQGLLQRDAWLESEARLDLLDVLPQRRWLLEPADKGSFRLTLHAMERRGLGPTRWSAVAGLAGGAPFQTVRADYFNIGKQAKNVRTFVRWDPRQRRAAVQYSQPLAGEAKLRWKVFADVRDEEWRLASSDRRFQAGLADVGVGFAAVLHARFDWGGEAAATFRSFSNAPDEARFEQAWGGRADSWLRWRALRLPARRITMTAETRAGLGSSAGQRFGKFEESLDFIWFPEKRSTRWRLAANASAGLIAGRAPFDALFSVGLNRDHRRWVRGVRDLRNSRKGGAPRGDRYWLVRTELERRIARFGFVEASAAPFFDVGQVADSKGVFGSQGVFPAVGILLRARVLGAFGFQLIYGRDLRRGSGVWFADTSR